MSVDRPDFTSSPLFGVARKVAAFKEAFTRAAPGLAALHNKAEAAFAEAARYGVTRADVQRILFPPGEGSPLQAFCRLAELRPLATLGDHLATALREAQAAGISEAELGPLQHALGFYQPYQDEFRALERRTGTGERRVRLPDDYLDCTPKEIRRRYSLQKSGLVGERAVALYELLAAKIPPQRQRYRTLHTPKYHHRALALAALLVSVNYLLEGIRPMSAPQLKARVQKRR